MTRTPKDSGDRHQPSSPLGQTCVVGASQSVAGLQAMRFAVAEARRRGTPLRAIRVFGFEPPWKGPEVARFQAAFARDALHYNYDAFDLAVGGQPGQVDLVVETPNDSVGSARTRAAAQADSLLVLGGRMPRRGPSAVVRTCLKVRLVSGHGRTPPPDLTRAWSKASVRKLLPEIMPSLNAW
jgi:hypothetical protein